MPTCAAMALAVWSYRPSASSSSRPAHAIARMASRLVSLTVSATANSASGPDLSSNSTTVLPWLSSATSFSSSAGEQYPALAPGDGCPSNKTGLDLAFDATPCQGFEAIHNRHASAFIHSRLGDGQRHRVIGTTGQGCRNRHSLARPVTYRATRNRSAPACRG